jgi:hypothetical protein
MWIWWLLALLAAAVVLRVAWGYPRPARAYRCLMRGEAAFLTGAAAAMFPRGGAITPSGTDADLTGYVDRLMTVSHPRIRLLLHLLFFLVEHATLVFAAPGRRGRRRFSSLAEDQQVAALDGWAESALFARRLVFNSLRATLTLGYFGYPPVLRQLGLAPFQIDPPIVEADLYYPAIGKSRDTIPYTREDLTPPGALPPLALDSKIHPDYAEKS